jgi:isocitrate dehydrogenase kinase/phosphatase
MSIEEHDTRNKLMSLALVNDCYKLIMELSSDASVIKQAIAFVNRRLPSKEVEEEVIESIQNQGEEDVTSIDVNEEEVIEDG